MAKKKKEDDGGAFILVFLGTAIVIVALAVPLLVLIAWIYFEVRCNQFPKNISLRTFALTSSESIKFRRLKAKYRQYKEENDQMEQKGRSLSRRKDGAYDGRSKLGRELNEKIAQLTPKLEETRGEVENLRMLPSKRLRNWSFNVAGRYSFRIGVLGYLIFSGLLYALHPEWLQNFSLTMAKLTMIKIFPIGSMLYGGTISAAIFTVLAIAPIWWFKKGSLETGLKGYDDFMEKYGEEETDEDNCEDGDEEERTRK